MNTKVLVAFLILASTVFTSFGQKKGKELLDSMLGKLPVAKEDTNKVKLLTQIGQKYTRSNPHEGVKYLMEAIKLAKKITYRDGISNGYYRLGNLYSFALIKPDSALYCYEEALKIEREKGDKEGIASLLTNMGGVYNGLSNFPKGLELLFQGLKLFEENGNKHGQANCYINIANVFLEKKEYDNSLLYYQKALQLYTSTKNDMGIALAVGNMGDIYFLKNDYAKAKTHVEKAMKIYQEIGDSAGLERNISNMGAIFLKQKNYKLALEKIYHGLEIAQKNDYYDAIGYEQALLAETYLVIASDAAGNATIPASLTKAKALELARSFADSAIVVLNEIGDLAALSETYGHLGKIQFMQGDYKNAYTSLDYFKQLNDSVFNTDRDKKLTQTAMQYEFDKKEAAAKAEQERKDAQQRIIRYSILAGLLGALIFLIVVYRQRNKIAKEKKRSEELLLNILPAEVAEELKEKGSADAKHIDEVTVLFTDFKGFTQLSEKLSPTELVAEINECFSAFDHIMEKYGVEKIKTIGDAYMAAGGLPTPNNTHPDDVVRAALDIQAFMHEHKKQKEAQGKLFFEIRIGIHTGPVVAGIVGVKKFQYDIWGDTVNTASRMESSGEAGRVNVSGTTYELVKDKFTFEHRGKITAKGKGEIDMYFVEG